VLRATVTSRGRLLRCYHYWLLDERAVNGRWERMGSCGMWIAIPRIEDRAIKIGQYGEKGTKLSERPGVVLVAFVLVQAGRSNLCPESPTDDIPPHDTRGLCQQTCHSPTATRRSGEVRPLRKSRGERGRCKRDASVQTKRRFPRSGPLASLV
jgi:hypothetical protein